jgi:hypothetical protein
MDRVQEIVDDLRAINDCLVCIRNTHSRTVITYPFKIPKNCFIAGDNTLFFL